MIFKENEFDPWPKKNANQTPILVEGRAFLGNDILALAFCLMIQQTVITNHQTHICISDILYPHSTVAVVYPHWVHDSE